MTATLRRPLAGLLLAATCALAACSHPKPVAAPPPPPLPAADRQAELNQVVALLDRGDVKAASPRIDALLRRDPNDPQARVLRDSVDKDPVALLGPKSFPYTVKPGDTMLSLSEKFLGNTLKAYQLARYNGIAVPATLGAGTVLRIPGTPPRVEEPRPAPRPRPSRGRSEPAAGAPAATPAPAPAAPAASPRADPAAARQARAAGLAALQGGNVDRAVALLRRAAQLNPADPLVQRDLQRAERIAATVHARR